jgi:glycosylphosphatidylinositol transamidase
MEWRRFADEWELALSTLPAGFYLLLERGVWGGNAAVMGARSGVSLPLRIQADRADDAHSVWVFVLLAIEAMKLYKSNPYFRCVLSQLPRLVAKMILIW